MKIGIDFDNTLVCCDQLFHQAARQKGLIPETIAAVKDQVRDHLQQAGREEEWTALQGIVYGQMLQEAPPFPGVKEFLALCRQKKIPFAIISHKTQVPAVGPPYPLRQAAQDWLEKQGFGIPTSEVFFEPTRKDKISRIVREKCTHFIDDIPELFLEPEFPLKVQRLLFDPHGQHALPTGVMAVSSWAEIGQTLLPR